MISAADIFCLAVTAGLMFLEAHRGIVPALITFIGVLVGLVATRIAYVPLSEQMRPSDAYMLLMLVTILLIALVSVVVTRRLKINVTEVEAAIGALLGLGTGLLFSYALFEWLSIRYGAGTPLVKSSLLYWAISESAGLREIGDFFRKLTGR